jgi:uroporphyrinogen-III synthase
VLLVQAAQGRELLREQLREVAEVDVAEVYRQVVVVDPANPVFERVRRGEVDAITLTSPNIATAFLGACDELVRQRLRDGPIRIIASSERLAGQLRAAGYSVVASANPTQDALIAALIGRM